MKLSEDQIEIGRWKATRLVRAHPPVDGWMRGAAMQFLRNTKQPNSQPTAAQVRKMVEAWDAFKASFNVENIEVVE